MTDPLIQVRKLTKSLVNIVFLCKIYCVTNAVAVMSSMNILMAEKRIVSFQTKKSESI